MYSWNGNECCVSHVLLCGQSWCLRSGFRYGCTSGQDGFFDGSMMLAAPQMRQEVCIGCHERVPLGRTRCSAGAPLSSTSSVFCVALAPGSSRRAREPDVVRVRACVLVAHGPRDTPARCVCAGAQLGFLICTMSWVLFRGLRLPELHPCAPRRRTCISPAASGQLSRNDSSVLDGVLLLLSLSFGTTDLPRTQHANYGTWEHLSLKPLLSMDTIVPLHTAAPYQFE